MIEGKSVLAIIPARGGSKGVSKKNIRDVAGKPLLAWTIIESHKSKYIDRTILSSENEEIIRTAKLWNCEVPFIRPKYLSKDDTPGVEPILHAINIITGYDYLVVLQPTSPLRNADDIDGCLEKIVSCNGDACVSVTNPTESPFWMYYINNKERLIPVLRQEEVILQRQKLPPVYALNGAIYIAKTAYFQQKRTFLSENTLAFYMPRERSIDIDSEFDLHICSLLLNHRNIDKGV